MKTKIFYALAVLPLIVGCLAPDTSTHSTASNHLQLANELREMQLYDSALATYRLAIEEFDSSGQTNEILECTAGMAYCWWALHKSDSAVALCRQAVGKYDLPTDKAPKAMAEIMTILGNVHADKRSRIDFAEALGFYQKALEIQVSNKAPPAEIVMAKERFGIANWLIGNYDEAEQWYRLCIREMLPLNESTASFHATLHSRLSSVLESMGRFHEAEENVKQAYEISKAYRLTSKVAEAEFLNKLGRIQLASGDPGQALVSYEAALFLQTEYGEDQNKLTALILSGLADCHCQLGEDARAMSYFLRAKEHWKDDEKDDANGLQTLYRQMAACHLRFNRPATATTLQLEALDIIVKTFGTHSIAWMLANEELGHSELLSGNYKGAIENFSSAKSAAKELLSESHPKHLEISLELAETELRSGDLTTCQKILEGIAGSPQLNPILSLSLILNLKYEQLNGMLNRAMFKEERNPEVLVEALRHYRRGIDLAQTSQRQFLNEMSELHLQQTVKRLCETALECCALLQQIAPSEAPPDLVLSFIEASSNVILAGANSNRQALAESSLPDDKSRQIRDLQQECRYYYHLMAAPPEVNNIAGGEEKNWQLSYFETLRKLESLKAEMTAKYPEFKKHIERKSFPSVKRMVEALPEGATFMAFLEGKEHLYRFRCDGRACSFQQLASARDYSPLLDSLLSFLHSNPPKWQSDKDGQLQFKRFCRQSNKLYQLLIGEPLKEGGKLVVAPSGKLHYLPFEILLEYEPDDDEVQSVNWRSLPYMFKAHAVQLVESAGMWLSPQTDYPFEAVYTGFAPEFDKTNSRLATLSNSIDEVQQSAGIWSGLAFTERDASLENFRKAAGNSAILHLATHAQLNNFYPGNSRVYFSGTEHLSAWEIANYAIPARLVVLSACDTGNGKLVSGDGVHSLSRAFRQAGAGATLMSLWAENDESGNDLLIPFMKNLKMGMSKSVALQQARKDFLARTRNDRMTHPHYWANLVLTGKDEALKIEQPVQSFAGVHNAWMLLLMAGMAIFLMWKWMRISP